MRVNWGRHSRMKFISVEAKLSMSHYFHVVLRRCRIDWLPLKLSCLTLPFLTTAIIKYSSGQLHLCCGNTYRRKEKIIWIVRTTTSILSFLTPTPWFGTLWPNSNKFPWLYLNFKIYSYSYSVVPLRSLSKFAHKCRPRRPRGLSLLRWLFLLDLWAIFMNNFKQNYFLN